MRTPEEWETQVCWNDANLVSTEHKDNPLLWIRAIQLDAWKQGMTDAAAIVFKGHESDFQRSVISIEIEFARNNKTTL